MSKELYDRAVAISQRAYAPYSNYLVGAVVQTNDGLVHRVTVGNHMGQNYGRIVAISDAQIQLVEIIPDGLGGFLERPAAIALAN